MIKYENVQPSQSDDDDEDEDDDKRDFYDFIDEVFSKRNNNESDDEEEEESESNSENEEDGALSNLSSVLKNQQSVNYKQQVVDNELYNRMLPKIEEGDESEDPKQDLNVTHTIKARKMSSSSKLGSVVVKPMVGKAPVIHLTKTARLRFELLKEQSGAALNTSQSVKRPASRMKEGVSVEKKPVLNKNLSLTPKQKAQAVKKPALAGVSFKFMRSANGDLGKPVFGQKS